MKLNSLNMYIFRTCLSILIIGLMGSCGTKPTFSSPTPSPLPPTKAKPASTEDSASLFKTGLSYSDASGDIPVSFLDVVAFQAAVDEDTETLEVLLHMRDIPTTATLGQVKNLIEYVWTVQVYLDPSKGSPADIPGDFYFALNTNPTSSSSGNLTPIAGEPIDVPINELFENKNVYRSSGANVAGLDVIANPDLNTLILKGRVPGIKSDAVFSFGTFYYDGTEDRPDNYDPESANVSSPRPEASGVPSDDTAQLIPAGAVRAYPGPEHYAGDVLTFEIQTDGSFGDETLNMQMTLDDNPPTEVSATSSFLNLLLPLALNTTNLTGPHTLKFRTADGRLNETYSFEVLPADQRPANEENAAWLVNEIDCCQLHYISNTAAARDIKLITEQFQQASEEVATITGGSMDAKLNVYLIDRIWGNGGFASEDGLVISYTDRYYGPTIGEKGLETLARHEMTHVTDPPRPAGDGIFFSNEGLAVYVAGGHYKPEPLAERGAALYDLGYYVPMGENIDQHELSYLHAGSVLTYIVETYGSDKLWEFLAADVDPTDGQVTPLETAIQSTFGISLNQFDQDFQAWLESKEPGQQLDDLRITIELQDLRRKYQETYAPPPYSIVWNVADTVARPSYLPVLIREADASANAATELIITRAQQAIIDGDYTTAEKVIIVLEKVVTTGGFEDPLAKDYPDIVLALEEAGYETLSLDLQGDQATAQVTTEPPVVSNVELEKVGRNWQLKP